MKSGAYKSEGYTLLYPDHYGVLDFRRGEVERPDFETMDGADVGDILQSGPERDRPLYEDGNRVSENGQKG